MMSKPSAIPDKRCDNLSLCKIPLSLPVVCATFIKTLAVGREFGYPIGTVSRKATVLFFSHSSRSFRHCSMWDAMLKTTHRLSVGSHIGSIFFPLNAPKQHFIYFLLPNLWLLIFRFQSISLFPYWYILDCYYLVIFFPYATLFVKINVEIMGGLLSWGFFRPPKTWVSKTLYPLRVSATISQVRI